MAYDVYMTAKKLKHYFNAHQIWVICEAPISEIMSNKDASGRIAKWAIELAPYTLQYDRRDAIKSQALADFLVDWAEIEYEPPPPETRYGKMHFDGSKMKSGFGADIKISGHFEGCEFHHIPRAENEAADTVSKLRSMRQAIPAGVALEHLRKPSIKPLAESESIFIPASSEGDATPMDIDGGSGSDNPGTERPNSAEAMAVEPMEVDIPDEPVFATRPVPAWAQPIMSYLKYGSLPEEEVSARQIQRRAKAYTIINGELYKKSVTNVLQRCVEPAEGHEILRDIHQGECGHHASSRTLVDKAFWHGFYWPSALQEAEDMVRKCNDCQRYASKIHMPASELKTIPITWPFVVWCLDVVEPFKGARGGMTHILVLVDKFTKWIKVKPIRKCDGKTAVSFLKDIILRYGYPHSVITDNGTNFAEGPFARFCAEKKIRLDVASVAHPQSNGQVERANGMVLAGIKPRLIEPLERTLGCWLDELPAMLWSLRTTPNRSTGYTSFFLVYGAEAVLPADIEHDCPRVTMYTKAEVKEARENDVNLLEESRELALSRSAIYQQHLRRYHSRRVNQRVFQKGDLVLRLVQRTAGMHKLSPP
ncbi:uncharacterized protein LOC112270039 [Brachypodium distachyon]|uniref:uncharacterized protein LOC112270039 n=1 Tax=Brachypodium distachyon TaxID=15368 RepID=UPI000D0D3ABA|nr:uncharacterized protein LOC112270039 [Brachypodium distachyon]|eukprot:XP_024313455.1 uncharacterized protein LOC112270039 [Brachypodium distachyon]